MALREVALKRLAFALDILSAIAYIMNMTMKQANKAAKAAGYPSAAVYAAAKKATVKTVTVETAAPTIKIDRSEGVHAGRIETGRAQYWDDDAKRDARYYD